MGEETLYERLGEQEGVRAMVDYFYDQLLADELVGPFFRDADMEKLRRTQTEFLCEAAGGPETYDAEPVREAHLHVPFEPVHIRRAVTLLSGSLEDFDVSAEDTEKVVQAVAAYEDDLLTRPDNNDN